MSTIKSSDEHLTLNADGSSKDIKFQANGVEKASISSAGAFTSTTIDATKLTGNLPAISGAALTGVGVAGISSSADATAMTITSDEKIGIGTTSPSASLHIQQTSDGSGLSGQEINTAYFHNQEATSGHNYGVRVKAGSNSTDYAFRVDTVATNSVFEVKGDGRGLSQFTAKAWASWNLNGTASIYDSHNVSSLSDNGTGDSSIHFSNNMANTNYAVAGMSDDTFRGLSLRDQSYTNVAYTRFASWISSNTTYDDAHRLMAVWFGD